MRQLPLPQTLSEVFAAYYAFRLEEILEDLHNKRAVANSMRQLIGGVHIVKGPHDENGLIEFASAGSDKLIISYLNHYAFNLACEDLDFRGALEASNFLLRDGVGVEFAMRTLGINPGRNLNGTDFIPRLLQASVGKTVAVYGTREPWLGRAVSRIAETGTNVVARLDGFHPDSMYVQSLRETDPDIVVLGMGMPKQEKLAIVLMQCSDRPRLIINGGAILDFYAARFVRAPRVVRRLRLEWAFRLAQEPRRLAGRYGLGGVQFLCRIVRILLASSRSSEAGKLRCQ